MVHHLPCAVMQADPVSSAQICLSCQDPVGFCPIRGGTVCIRKTPKSFNRKYSICLRPQKPRNNITEGKKLFSTCEPVYLCNYSVLTSCSAVCMTCKKKRKGFLRLPGRRVNRMLSSYCHIHIGICVILFWRYNKSYFIWGKRNRRYRLTRSKNTCRLASKK